MLAICCYNRLTSSGPWWNEVSYPYNTITDGENVTAQGIAQILGIWDFIKNSGKHPESANMGLTWIELTAGKREGRRFRGQYIVKQNDVMAKGANGFDDPQDPTLFWDRVAYGTFRLNFHRFDRFELDLRGHTQP